MLPRLSKPLGRGQAKEPLIGQTALERFLEDENRMPLTRHLDEVRQRMSDVLGDLPS